MSKLDITSHFSGDLNRLHKMIATAVVFFGFLLLAIIAYAGWSANQTATEGESTLLKNAFNQSIARALNEQKSVAWWDDAVVKITGKAIDLDFVDANFGIFLTETYGHDEVYILNGEDRPLYAFQGAERRDPSIFERRRVSMEAVIEEARRGDQAKLSRRPDSFSELQSNYRKLAGAVEVARWAGHIISVAGQPAIIAALTIVPNVNMSLLKGTPNLLVSITYIDQPFITEIGRSLLLNDLALLSSPAQRYGVVSEPFVVDDGATVGYLSWTTRRPGQVLLTIILPLVALGTIATGILSMTMLRRLRRTSEELAKRESQARYESKHDALSGLPNRVNMVEKIEKFLHAPDRGDRRAVAAYIDIDRFKDINDTLGHDAGDQLIKAVAARLKSRLRPKEFLSRFGGDEFVILTAPVAPRHSAAVAERVAQAFALPFAVNGQNIRVTASVGLAFAPDNGVSADELMRHADIALYRAKNTGRDRAVTFTEEMAQEVEHRRSIELDLREALESDTLRLNYQPLISCRTGEICGIEALLRWNHPIHGEIPPADFIPIAESSGLLPAVGEWVLERAMSDSTRWPNIEIAINLSPVQFRHLDIDTTLHALVAKHGIDPRRFVLEITEGVLLEASERTVSILDKIRGMGFKIALDDFGTRYSSLAYLCNFKFDKIKIDRSFIRSISNDETSRRIVQSVIGLSRGLGIDVVAEGIETETEAAIMTHFGCTELQGYYFSRPINADQMTDFLILFQPRPIIAQGRGATG